MRNTTKKMKDAIEFIEDSMVARFIGDIDNYDDVSCFIASYLGAAKKKSAMESREYYW